MPSASIVVPTHERPSYLAVALDSLLPQARAAGADVLVVVDGIDAASAAVARERGARAVSHSRPRGLNAARNAAGWHVCLDRLAARLAGEQTAAPGSGPTEEWRGHYDEYQRRDVPSGAPIPTGAEKIFLPHTYTVRRRRRSSTTTCLWVTASRPNACSGTQPVRPLGRPGRRILNHVRVRYTF